MTDYALHEECWLVLPWLASGRLPQAQRARVDEHVRECEQCMQQLAQERLMCATLSAPERVSYAPGPSFRKLMERIDGHAGARPARPLARAPAPARAMRRRALSAWRPPGLAWAASFLLAFGCAALIATGYRWSQPVYITHTAAAAPVTQIVHVAFLPSLSVAEAGAALRSAGARVVEGPDASGIIGVAPLDQATARGSDSSPALRALAARLRADPRVRWVEPEP
jgi:hypothetical protein